MKIGCKWCLLTFGSFHTICAPAFTDAAHPPILGGKCEAPKVHVSQHVSFLFFSSVVVGGVTLPCSMPKGHKNSCRSLAIPCHTTVKSPGQKQVSQLPRQKPNKGPNAFQSFRKGSLRVGSECQSMHGKRLSDTRVLESLSPKWRQQIPSWHET